MTDEPRLQTGVLRGISRIYGRARPYWKLFLVTILCMVLHSASISGRAYLIKPLLDQVILPATAQEPLTAGSVEGAEVAAPGTGGEVAAEAGDSNQAIIERLKLLLLVTALIVISVPITGFLRHYLSAYITNRVTLDLQCELCDRLLHMPLQYHARQRQGELVTRLTNDVPKASTTVQLMFGELIQEPLTLIMGVGVMFFVSWQLTLLLLVLLPLLIYSNLAFGRRIRGRSLKRQEQMVDLMGAMIQMFSGILTVKAFRREERELGEFRELNEDVFRKSMKVVKTEGQNQAITDLFNNGTFLVFLGLGILAILNSALGLTLPILITVLALAISLYPSINRLSRAWSRLSDAMGAIVRVVEILDLEPESKRDGDRPLVRFESRIAFDGVWFAYDEREFVLSDISLEIEKGETVALVGPTGAGKTSLCNLIARLYDPTRGAVLIDGVDIQEYRQDDLSRCIAIVPQEPFLFDTSVADNIRYGRPEAGIEEIRAAARAAQIDRAIMALPDGYDTSVGARGSRLSGGERQRVTIARAILKDPSILILDEATASLDAESESLVKQALSNLVRDRTTVVIAHRFSTILNADRILLLEDGRITAQGAHAELVSRSPLYRKLCELQVIPEISSQEADPG